jgi:glycosyltransferase involved in cell wall biosynthesis
MDQSLISVLLIGAKTSADQLILEGMQPYEACNFSVLQLDVDEDISQQLAAHHFNVICTFGNINDFSILNSQQLDVRKRWLHYEDPEIDLSFVAQNVMGVYLVNATTKRFPETPLVSVFTPTYMTGTKLLRPYQSLCQQSYDNWEWVIYDDSPDDATFKIASSLADFDHRIKVFKSSNTCGRIGEVKRRCCALATGSVFVELDHDDELTFNCLKDLVEAFQTHPDAGFAYTDCAEILETGENATYPEGYAFGFGSYRHEPYGGHVYAVTNYPSLNAKTVRHIVGMPNHARAWTREAYYAAGGHGAEVHVADDYELCIRTFLTTRMVHVKRFGYIQHIDTSGSNTQRVRNKEIQRLVKYFSDHYNEAIHDRFIELGIDDFIWTKDGLDWSLDPSDNHAANLTLE